MATSAAKEKILKKIRKALSNPVPLPFPESEGKQSVYPVSGEDSTIVFAEEFTRLQGKFAYCPDERDLTEQLFRLFSQREFKKIWYADERVKGYLNNRMESHDDLASCDASVTLCESLVARTGSIVLSSALQYGRTGSVYAPIHICIGFTSQLVYDIGDALEAVKIKYNNNLPSVISFASGPSRTADIEKTLVTGVHGPKEVYCFLVEG